jgi:glutathione S-transferase
VAAALPVLWQFRHSHFNEKARWALDWKGVRHVRRSLLPALHVPRVLMMTGQKSVPVLVVEGRAIHDSTRIIEELERSFPGPPLLPKNAAERQRAQTLEEFFDVQLGPHLRLVMFHGMLPHTAYAAETIAVGCSPAARAAYRALFPAVRALMRFDMRIDDRRAALGREKIAAALDRIEAELRPSGYLVGDGFTVADLTAAALLSPILVPPEFPYPLPGPMPEPLASYRASLARRPGFQWALDMYARHRGRSAEVVG